MRKNIFQIQKNRFNLTKEIKRIDSLLSQEAIYIDKFGANHTIFEFVDDGFFIKWKQRYSCINCKDMMEVLKIDKISKRYKVGIIDALIYLEFLVNIIKIFEKGIKKFPFPSFKLTVSEEYEQLKNNILSLIEHLNMEVKYFCKEEKAIIVEKNKAATAVAEIVDDNLAHKVIEYNHYLLKRNISKKKHILNEIHSELEPKRQILENLNKILSDNVFYMFNNINIRHNNREKGKNYKEFVSKMSDKELEGWYDETYQLALLAILLLDNIPRTEAIKKLKLKIENK